MRDAHRHAGEPATVKPAPTFSGSRACPPVKAAAAASRARLGLALAMFALAIATGCGSGSSGGSTASAASPTSAGGNTIAAPAANVQQIIVSNGPNFILTTVTVCVPGSGNCIDVPDVLVDTGSFGLRILASAVPGLTLPQSSGAGGPLAECVQFLDNSLVWGSVRKADVKMAGEVASAVPIQFIGDPAFPTIPGSCGSAANAHESSQTLGANGILGIGLLMHDCGPTCVTNAPPGQYFACPSTGCVPTSVALAEQVQNPVALFAGPDHNGTILQLPALPPSGRASVTGALVFGIGTQSNNALGNATVLQADASGNFTTSYNGQSFSGSFIDSGSNAVYFLSSTTTGIPACTNTSRFGPDVVKFYCPASSQNLAVAQVGINGASSSFTFNLTNAESQFSGGSEALGNIGGPNPGSFDWGVPFFFGRNIYTAIQDASTPVGSGPFWAY